MAPEMREVLTEGGEKAEPVELKKKGGVRNCSSGPKKG